MGKYLISLDLEERFLQFFPDTLEHPSLHLSDDQFASLMLIAKIRQKIEKTVFLD